jgi:Ca2+-binding RTX toxin-like protein
MSAGRAVLVVTIMVGAMAQPVTATAAAVYYCAGKVATIVGSPYRADRIVGTDGPDVIVGLRGADHIDGGKGDDVICGNNGADVIYGGEGNDLVLGQGDGYDGIRWHGDTVDGGPGDDRINAGDGPSFDNRLSFTRATSGVTVNAKRGTASGESTGNDRVTGFDIVHGTAYDDRIVGVTWVDAGAGDDVVRDAQHADGREGDDRLVGREFIDSDLEGGPGNDVVKGRSGPDDLIGGTGDDRLVGGKSEDQGFGEAGDDICIGIEHPHSCEPGRSR